jgi:putative ABC transport system permease protein
MYDYLVTFEEHQTETDQTAFLNELDGAAEHCIFLGNSALDVPSKVGIKSVNIISCSDPAIDDILGLYWDETDLGYPTGDGMYISHALAEDADLQVGDVLPIQLESKAMLETPITGIFTNYVSHYAFLTEEGYETWFGIEPEIKGAYLTAAEGQDLYSLNADLQSMGGVLHVTMTQDMKAMVSDAISSMNAIIVLIVLCAAALAFVVGYNLININITERVREIATIKVLGFYQKETYDYVFREAILLTIMGTIVGVPLGNWLNRFIISVVKVDFVRFQAQITPLSYVIGVILTVLVTLIVDKMLSKKIDKINMAESLKSVE